MKFVSASRECRSPPMWADELVFANYLNLATPKKTKGWSPRLREGIISGHRDMT